MSEPSPRPVILTRTGTANTLLAAEASKRGIPAFLWPAFSIRLPEDDTRIRETLTGIRDFDLVHLVSPATVRSLSHWVKKWPAGILISAAGSGTARAAHEAWGESLSVISPEGDTAHSGSEALLSLLESQGLPRRLLICRGDKGREWLSEKLAEMGVHVEKLACYERVPYSLSEDDKVKLREAIGGPSPVLFAASSEAFEVIRSAVSRVQGAWEWILSGGAAVIHPRIREKAESFGFRVVEMTPPDPVPAFDCMADIASRLGSS